MKKVCGNCRFCKRAISSMPCRICKDWNRWKPKKETTEFTIEELEKIKEEMNVELFKEYSAEREFDSGYESCLKQQIDRIDNHIKELKGENNDENKTDN